MLGINKAILIGRLGKDPELRRTANGTSVVSFTIATTERWSDKNGERQDRTEWHTIVAWGKLAELSNQYLKKGRPVYIEGRITNRSWEDKDGIKRNKTEIIANQIQFLGSSNETDSGNATNYKSETSNNTGSIVAEEPPKLDSIEDDLPF